MSVPDFAGRDAGRLQLVEFDAARLVRITRYPDTEPYFGRQKRNRFDDPSRQFGVLYAGEGLDVAFAETLLHEDSTLSDGAWVVDALEVKARSVVQLRHERPLLLGNLTGHALKSLGLDNRLSADTCYDFTWDLSRVLHEAVQECDGILYVSRHVNTRKAVALFERSAVGVASELTIPLLDHPDFPQMLDVFRVTLIDAEAPSGMG
jgi:hypothetical protein